MNDSDPQAARRSLSMLLFRCAKVAREAIPGPPDDPCSFYVKNEGIPFRVTIHQVNPLVFYGTSPAQDVQPVKTDLKPGAVSYFSPGHWRTEIVRLFAAAVHAHKIIQNAIVTIEGEWGEHPKDYVEAKNELRGALAACGQSLDEDLEREYLEQLGYLRATE